MRRAEIHQRVLWNKKSIEIDLIKIQEMIKRIFRYLKASSKLIWIFHNGFMYDPILYISMILGFGGIYILISSFHDDDDDDNDDGERYYHNFQYSRLAR